MKYDEQIPTSNAGSLDAVDGLRYCPFCGGPARLYAWLFFGWYVQCGCCGARAGRVQNTKAEAAEIWNRRMPQNQKRGGPAQ